MSRRPPTERELAEITKRIRAKRDVANVDVFPVVYATVTLKTEKARRKIYDLEAEIMKDYPHLRFDFSTVVKGDE